MAHTEAQIRYLFSRFSFCVSSIPLLQGEIDNLEKELAILEGQEDLSLKSPNMDGMPRSGSTSDPTPANAFGGRDVAHIKKVLAEKLAEMSGFLESVTTVKQWLTLLPPYQRAAVEGNLIRRLSFPETVKFVQARVRKKYSVGGIKYLVRKALDEIIKRNDD